MKKNTVILSLFLFFSLSLSFNVFAQPDTTNQKTSKIYRSNIKTQGLLILPLYTAQLSYEYGVTKKSALGLLFFYRDFTDIKHLEEWVIMPYFRYYLSKFKNDKYNRGLYLQGSLTYHHRFIDWPSYYTFYDQGLYVHGGIGYQFIFGKRFPMDFGLTIGPSIFRKRKDITYGDDFWKNAPTNISQMNNFSLGITF